jgi:hypothetical protein
MAHKAHHTAGCPLHDAPLRHGWDTTLPKAGVQPRAQRLNRLPASITVDGTKHNRTHARYGQASIAEMLLVPGLPLPFRCDGGTSKGHSGGAVGRGGEQPQRNDMCPAALKSRNLGGVCIQIADRVDGSELDIERVSPGDLREG